MAVLGSGWQSTRTLGLEEKWSSGSSARRSERPSVSSLASTASPSADESDSGFHGYRSRRYRSPDGRSLDEASESSRLQGDRLNTSCDSSLILRPGERQPLYANAPPKPKRLNSSRDYSTSPERSPERDERDPRIYTDHGGGNGAADSRSPDARGLHFHPPSAERRTPDAYGVTSGGARGDYEDVYGDSNGSSSLAQSPIRKPEQRDSFASSRSGGTRLSEELQLADPMRPTFRGQEDTLPRVSHPDPHHRHRPQGPPRPHSADFLEYDRRHGSNDMWSYRRGSGGDLPRPNEIRPKSSVGQSDLDHWSEENYAQKMRQSSLYHTHMHSRPTSRFSAAGKGESPVSDHHHLHSPHGVPQRVPPAGAATPDLYTPHKPSNMAPGTTNSLRHGMVGDSRPASRQDLSQDPRADVRPDLRQDPRHDLRPDPRLDSRPVHMRSEPRQDPRQGMAPEVHRQHNHEDPHNRSDTSPNTTLNSVPTPPGSYQNSASPSGSANNSFMRSASARLPRHKLQDDMMNTSLPDDGSDGDTKKMQQREESMKRLLEWKQRMLQSPLTRKTSPRQDATATPQPRTNSEAYRQQVLNELATQEARSKSVQSHGHGQSQSPGRPLGQVPPSGPVPGKPHGFSPNGSAGLHHGAGSQPGQVSSDCSVPQEYMSASPMSQGHVNQSPMCVSGRGPGERPAPQGSSSHQSSDSGSSRRREGRRENSRTRHVSGGDSRRSASASRYNSYSSDEEDVKLGESLPRRPDPNAPNSGVSQGSTHAHAHAHAQKYHHPHAHHQNYQHHPHPHSQNPYHHYKSDELHKYSNHPGQNYQSNGPYANSYHSGHGYHSNYPEEHANYPNNFKAPHNRAPNYQDNQGTNPNNYNNTLNSQRGVLNGSYRQPSHYDFQDYHNFKNHQQDYKNHQQDYGTYGKHPRHHDQRINGRVGGADPHQQYSDSELTVSKARLAHLDGEHREDHLRRLAALNHHLHDLDKQYEMGKPLINLVDNMVKLGSLYRGGDSRLSAPRDSQRPRSYYPADGYDSLQFSRRIQERRIVAEDMQEYELAAADQADLEGKVMQLYKLDKNLQQESLTIQSLQREKEMLECTLVNLNSKSHGANEGPVELERRKKQRRHLEHELSKLRAHLAVSARKLEETAAENSRLEHEMMMLRQKIQVTMARNCQRESSSSAETRHIEAEMVRVQTLLEDLQRRRIELSHQIQRLTSSNPGIELRPSPTGVVGAAPVPARKRRSTWLETDLDAMITRDRGLDPPEDERMPSHPVYVNASGYPDKPLLNGDLGGSALLGLDRDAADNQPDGEEQQQSGSHLDINDADDRMKRYYGILPKEKPLEIKTVRIVKRESTERKKDRSVGGKRVTIGENNLTYVTEDDIESDGLSDVENEPPIPSFASRSASLPRNYGRNGPGERVSMMAAMMRTSVGNAGTMTRPNNLALKKSAEWKAKNENLKGRPLSAHEQLFGFSREAEQTPPASPSKSDPPSPVFKSAAAQEIIKEMASEAEKHRRSVPKEKRRHFTISSSRPLMLETRDTGLEEGARSRDDCDMVRALRPRNHPDVVKSTLSTRDLRFNETTIDSILGAPDKIYIPERYMPDEDDEKEPTEEERAQREQKAESIRKMLSETQTTVTATDNPEVKSETSETAASSSSAFKAKIAAEKKEREHLLALNQILARQVMEKSRVVAAHNTVEPHL